MRVTSTLRWPRDTHTHTLKATVKGRDAKEIRKSHQSHSRCAMHLVMSVAIQATTHPHPHPHPHGLCNRMVNKLKMNSPEPHLSLSLSSRGMLQGETERKVTLRLDFFSLSLSLLVAKKILPSKLYSLIKFILMVQMQRGKCDTFHSPVTGEARNVFTVIHSVTNALCIHLNIHLSGRKRG